MSELGKRAIEACVEYDTVKRKIDEATSTIASCLEKCEERQRDEIDKRDYEDEFKYFDAIRDVKSCLRFYHDTAEYDCVDCKQALKVIRKRKQLRQDFGVAKRKIRAVARAKYKSDE